MSLRKSCSVIAIVTGWVIAASPVTASAVSQPRRTVTFGGVSLKVPASWPVVNLARHPRACPRLDVHAVYLGPPGPDPACPADLRGKTAAVTIRRVDETSPDAAQAIRRTVIGGRPARTNADASVTHTIIDVLPSAGTEVSLSYGTGPALVRAIQASIRISGNARPTQLATPAAITPAAAQGVVKGPGFDTCAAPSATAMKAWRASPYRAVGVYIGGINRACAQANLTSGWIHTIQGEGWHYFPFYVGLQAPCVAAFGDATISSGSASAEGAAAADDAVTQARDLGIPSGTPVIYDMEAYRGGCGPTVATFLSAWDSELHAKGYVAGLYESFSNVPDLVSAAGTMTEPDVIHYADWDGRATTSSPYMPSGRWAHDQRIHQYLGGHNQAIDGVTMNIDSDQLDVSLGGAVRGQVRSAFRIADAMNSNGSAEWFARATDGTLRHNYQHPIGSPGWSATRAVGDSPAGLVGNPAVSANADGTLTLFARSAAGRIVHAWQQDGAPNDWQWAGAVGGGKPPGPVPDGQASDPAAIRASDGAVTVFVTSATGNVAMTRQFAPNDNRRWSAWTSLGGDCGSSPVPFVDGRRTLEVFCTTTHGSLAVDTSGPGGWRGWHTMGGGPAGLTGPPAAVADGSGQTEVFAATRSGGLDYAWQAPGADRWAWGSPPSAGGQKIRNAPAAVAWPGGGVGVIAQLSHGRPGYAVQRGPASSPGWTGWTPMTSHLLGSPAAWVNVNGDPEVAILTRRLHLAVSTYSAGTWAPWTRLGGGY